MYCIVYRKVGSHGSYTALNGLFQTVEAATAKAIESADGNGGYEFRCALISEDFYIKEKKYAKVFD